MLLDFFTVTMKMKPLPPEDELTRGLRTVFETKKLYLWVIFATQTYLDINYVFYANVSRGYWDLHKFASSIYESINQNLVFFEKIRCDPWPISKDEELHQLQKDIKTRLEDDLVRQKKKQIGYSGSTLGKSNQHWKSHPVRCGLAAYNIKMRYLDLSIQFEDKWQGIYYTYQLYYALRLENVLRKPWKDMETLLEAQPQIDLSKRARNLQDVLVRVGTDLGISSTMFGSDRQIGSRIPIVDERTENIRLQERNPVALMFKKRLCDGDGRTEFTEQDLVNILSRAVPASSSKGTMSKVERPTIPQLLRTLRANLVSENSYADFDYLEFQRLCWQLLREVQPKCEEELKKKFGPSYLPHDHLPFICSAILAKGIEALLEDDNSGKALFVTVGVRYATFMRDNGSKVIDSVAKRGFDPSKDSVIALNSAYDKDDDLNKILRGPGDKRKNQEAWARQVTEREMDKITEVWKLGPATQTCPAAIHVGRRWIKFSSRRCQWPSIFSGRRKCLLG